MEVRRGESAAPDEDGRGGGAGASWGFRVTYGPGSRRGVVRPKPDQTVHFLDVCALDVTKRTDDHLKAHPDKEAMAARLRELDLPTNRFSCLLALMEKTSDTTSRQSDDELRAQIVDDIEHMRRFFQNAADGEPNEYVEDYIRQLRRLPAELARPIYLSFLHTANEARFGLHQPIAKPKRSKIASILLELADSLGIRRQHPVVVVTLACLYGNGAARDVLKFTPKSEAFPAENVLADLMAIGRFAIRKLELEQDYWLGLSYVRHAAYITRDKGLAEVMACFHAKGLTTRDADAHQKLIIRLTVDFADLLTEISHEPGQLLDPSDPRSARPSEYDRVCALVFG